MRTPIGLFSTLALLAAASVQSSAVTSNVADVSGTTWDWIIIGAGLGGLVTANRLSANPDINVLVVEAGGDNRTSNLVDTVNTYSQAFQTSLDWQYVAENQVGGSRTLNAGKTIGGSTSINGAAWGRAAAAQYDALANYTQDTAFSWDNILTFFKRSEHFYPPDQAQQKLGAGMASSDVHGFNGPIDVAYTPAVNDDSSSRRRLRGSRRRGNERRLYTDAYGQDFLAAAKRAIGLRQTYDSSSGDLYGVGMTTPNSITPVDGDPTGEKRSSAATGYLNPVEQRSNLRVLIGWRGVRPLFATDNQTLVTGAEIQAASGGEKVRLQSKHGVIVSAGAIGSPLFLERGGVGDPTLLQNLGIQVHVPLAGVGSNLQDQTMKSLAYKPANPFTGHGPSSTIAFPSLPQLLSNASAVRSWVQSSYSQWASETVERGGSVSQEALLRQWKVLEGLIWDENVSIFEMFVDHGFPEGGLGADCWNLLPFSRGSVHISSADAWAPPKLDPGYFTVPLDLDVSIAGWRAVRKVAQTAPLNYTLSGELIPGNKVPDDSNGGKWEDWSNWGLPDYSAVAHQIGTAQIAPQDQGGVVGSDGTVYGTHGSLRVIDGSVLPFQLSAHLSASLYALAEKLAADVVEATLQQSTQ